MNQKTNQIWVPETLSPFVTSFITLEMNVQKFYHKKEKFRRLVYSRTREQILRVKSKYLEY